METIRHRVGIQAPASEVLAKLTTLDGLATWWTRDVTGDPGVGRRAASSSSADPTRAW